MKDEADQLDQYLGVEAMLFCPTFLQFLSRVSILTRDIHTENMSVRLSVRPSVRHVPVLYENGLKYCHSFFHRSQIILVFPASNIFTKFRRGLPLRGH